MYGRGTESFFFFSSRRRHTRFDCDWSSDVCSSDLFDTTHLFGGGKLHVDRHGLQTLEFGGMRVASDATDLALQFAIARGIDVGEGRSDGHERLRVGDAARDRKSTRLNSSHSQISYAVFCLKKKT